jgi:hypothetical protein
MRSWPSWPMNWDIPNWDTSVRTSSCWPSKPGSSSGCSPFSSPTNPSLQGWAWSRLGLCRNCLLLSPVHPDFPGWRDPLQHALPPLRIPGRRLCPESHGLSHPAYPRPEKAGREESFESDATSSVRLHPLLPPADVAEDPSSAPDRPDLSGSGLTAGPKGPKHWPPPLAQLDRAPDFESVGRGFESLRAGHGSKDGGLPLSFFSYQPEPVDNNSCLRYGHSYSS